MIDLRQLKSEARNLPNLETHFQHFQNQWFKPIKAPLAGNSSNISRSLPNLNRAPRLDPKIRSELFHRVQKIEEVMPNLKGSQAINEKLFGYSRLLIELKLALYTGNWPKARAIHHQLLKDEFMGLRKTLQEIRELENLLSSATGHYLAINRIIQNHLPLDERLALTESPDHHRLRKMKDINFRQKQLMAELGKHFISLSKQARKIKNF